MKIREKSRQTGIIADACNGDINYDLNYNIQGSELTSLNGIVTKTAQQKDGDAIPANNVQLGSFSVFSCADNPTINLNLNADCALTDKQAILADIYAILDELKGTNA